MYFVRVPFYGVIVLSPDWKPLVTVLWLLVMTQAINLIDGLDGLAAGIVAIGAFAFFLYSQKLTDLGLLDSGNVGPLLAMLATNDAALKADVVRMLEAMQVIQAMPLVAAAKRSHGRRCRYTCNKNVTSRGEGCMNDRYNPGCFTFEDVRHSPAGSSYEKAHSLASHSKAHNPPQTRQGLAPCQRHADRIAERRPRDHVQRGWRAIRDLQTSGLKAGIDRGTDRR
jgi:hypothetical protein